MYVVYNGGVLTLEQHLDAVCLRGLPVEVRPNRSLAFVSVCLPPDLCVIKHDGLSSQAHFKATCKLTMHAHIGTSEGFEIKYRRQPGM